jgi:hypothetical protein
MKFRPDAIDIARQWLYWVYYRRAKKALLLRARG